MANEALTLEVVAGGGSVSSPTLRTASDGSAETQWTLGMAFGAQSLRFRAGTASVLVSATAKEGVVQAVSPSTGAAVELEGGGIIVVPASASGSLPVIAITESEMPTGDRLIELLPGGVELGPNEAVELFLPASPGRDWRDVAVYARTESGLGVHIHGSVDLESSTSTSTSAGNIRAEQAPRIKFEISWTGGLIANYTRRMAPGTYSFAIDPAWDPDQQSAVRAGVKRWMPYLQEVGISIEETSSLTAADIPIHRAGKDHEVFNGILGADYDRVLGRAQFGVRSGVLRSRIVWLRDNIEGGDDYVSRLYNDGFDAVLVALEVLAAHEFGHAMGLEHPSHARCSEPQNLPICAAPPVMARYSSNWFWHPFALTQEDIQQLALTFSRPSFSLGAPQRIVPEASSLPSPGLRVGPGAQVGQSMSFVVTDAAGRPIPNATVLARPIPPGGYRSALEAGVAPGSVAGSVARSNSNGRVLIESWMVGEAPGVHRFQVLLPVADEALWGPNQIDMSQINLNHPAIWTVEATVVAPSRLAVQEQLSASPGAQIALNPVVFATDGEPLEGVNVHFAAPAGALSATSSITDAQGIASVTWTAPSQPGQYQITVTAGSGGTQLQGSPGTINAVVSAAPPNPGNLGMGFGDEQFALVPAGTFQMGDTAAAPVHTVNITRPFRIQRTEVTQGQWGEIMGSNPSSFSSCGDTCPVEQVSWDDIQQFLAALNTRLPGRNFRLPTEAEWEYAARAGTTGDYGGTGVLEQMGWHSSNSESRTHPAARKEPNDWGLYDMHGNVAEWVLDWYSGSYYRVSPTDDPPGPSTGTLRVVRGGSWSTLASWPEDPGAPFLSGLRSAYRGNWEPTGRRPNIGFRLAMDVPAPPPPSGDLGTGFGDSQFALVPAGSFQMGSTNGSSGELPVHPVNVTRAFYMQRTEVTQGQWREVMGNSPSRFNTCGDTCPVELVSWNDVQDFLAVLNRRYPGRNYRLPTEAEWEYAARAETTGDYGGTGVLEEMGWYQGNAGDRTHPVAGKRANAWGLYDMHGNVWEHVQDWFSRDYYSVSPVSDPPGPPAGTSRAARGGGWASPAASARSAARGGQPPWLAVWHAGFRLARTP